MNKLRSLHFRLLRTACNDHFQQHSKEYLFKRCRRATPDEWVKYCTSSIVIKTKRDKNPNRLHSLLRSSYLEEPRRAGYGKFYDKSSTKCGKQSINCRLEQTRLINCHGVLKTCPMIRYASSWRKLSFITITRLLHRKMSILFFINRWFKYSLIWLLKELL